MRKALIAVGCVMILVFAFAAGLKWSAPENLSPDEVISNNDNVVAAIRSGLRDHSRQITVTFSFDRDILSDLPDFVRDWMDAAMRETSEATEGDYIRYQYGGYESSSSYARSGQSYSYTVTIVPKYYMYLVQEEAVTEKLAAIFEEFGFDEGTTDYEKIRTIYDYICSHVSYDKVHRKNSYYYMRSTSYAALVQETATCQGYCVALYRMLRQAGLDSRIITGTEYAGDSDTLHAWNIVGLDGVYYCLDATWDAGKDDYAYFLRGTKHFSDHIPGEEFSAADFLEQYPISDEDYVPCMYLERGGIV